MVVPLALATAVISALVPLLTKEEVVTGAGKELWNLIKSRFKSTESEKAIVALESNPASVPAQDDAKLALANEIKNDPPLGDQMESLLNKMKAENTQTITGNDNIAIQDVQGSVIEFHK